MKKKKALVYLLFIFLLIALAAYVHGIQRVDARKLDRLISRSLPAGSDKVEVIRFLDSNHISHSEYFSEYRRIYGSIPKSTIGLANGNIFIEFRFDENGKLVRYELDEVFS